jgi:hypothetical protein
MSEATTYAEWARAAKAHDERSGAARWKREDKSRRYDYRVIRRRLQEILEVKARNDPHEILFYLNEGIHGNMGGMGSSSLYRKAKFGTKDLITDYTEELAGGRPGEHGLRGGKARVLPSGEPLFRPFRADAVRRRVARPVSPGRDQGPAR